MCRGPAGTIRWINVEMKFRTTSQRYFNYISTLFQCQMPAGGGGEQRDNLVTLSLYSSQNRVEILYIMVNINTVS